MPAATPSDGPKKAPNGRPWATRRCGGGGGVGGDLDVEAAQVDGSRAVHRLRRPRREGVRGGIDCLLDDSHAPRALHLNDRHLRPGHSRAGARGENRRNNVGRRADGTHSGRRVHAGRLGRGAGSATRGVRNGELGRGGEQTDREGAGTRQIAAGPQRRDSSPPAGPVSSAAEGKVGTQHGRPRRRRPPRTAPFEAPQL